MNVQLKESWRYRVTTMPGVAFYVDEYCEEHDGCVKMIMVGDDYRHHVQHDDLERIHDSDYCGGCGQIGCGWG